MPRKRWPEPSRLSFTEVVQAVREGATDIGVIMEGMPTDGLQCFDYKTDRLVAVVPTRRRMFVCVRDYELLPSIARKLVDHQMKEKQACVRSKASP